MIVILVIAALAVAGYFMFRGGEKKEYVLTEAVKGKIVQTVSVTGSIKAEPTIDLHFKKNGEVSEILVKEGERVEKDRLLASLENKSLDLEIKRNDANLSYTKAEYEKLKAGTRAEEVKIAEAEVASAKAAYEAALTDQQSTESIGAADIDLAQLAYEQAADDVAAAERDLETTKSLAEKQIAKLKLGGDNVSTVELDSAYANAKTRMASTLTVMQDSISLAEKIIGVWGEGIPEIPSIYAEYFWTPLYFQGVTDLKEASDLYTNLTPDSEDDSINSSLFATVDAANTVSSLLVFLSGKLQSIVSSDEVVSDWITKVTAQSSTLNSSLTALNDIVATIQNLQTGTVSDTETLILDYQLRVDAAENTYNTAVNRLDKAKFDLDQSKVNAENNNNNARAQVSIREAALNSATASLNLKKSPVRQVDLAPLAAQIRLAEVAIEIAQNEYRDSQLFAPIDGMVTFIYGKVGQNVSVSEIALSAFLTIQADNLIVEANVPETDVSKIKPGDKVTMTIDAFDFTEKFEGSVVYIDPAETVIQGVVYYQIKTAFDLKDERLKSGMTTNLDIVTAQKDDVLIIPARAIKYEDSIRYVEVLNNGKPVKTIIKTGLESDQDVEVTEGLKEGDKIITFVK